MSNFIFYVYAYIRKSNGQPYYIGKGKGDRAFSRHRGISVPKDRSKIVFLEQNLSEVGAFALERRYIKWYGRKNIENGILLNKAEGGEGSSGYMPTIEQRMATSERSKGNKHNLGRKQTTESNLKRSIALKGRPKSIESNIKKSISLKGKPKSIESNLKQSITKIESGMFKGDKNPMYGKRGDLSPLKNKRWWTNGVLSTFCEVCPPGYRAGRTLKVS